MLSQVSGRIDTYRRGVTRNFVPKPLLLNNAMMDAIGFGALNLDRVLLADKIPGSDEDGFILNVEDYLDVATASGGAIMLHQGSSTPITSPVDASISTVMSIITGII